MENKDFEEMINTIQLGDCYELIKKIPDKSIDLIVTDPPYELETEGSKENKLLFDLERED